MTETSPVSTMTRTDDPITKRIDTVGRLLPHVSAKVVSATDKSQIMPIGAPGELAVAGYNVMKYYWNDPVRTAEVMIADEQGRVWMHTGDEAVMDEDGFVKIVGRLKDLIIRGGENIHPLEIENRLFAHPDISEASVTGLPDDKYGEVVAAFIVPKAGKQVPANVVRDWVREGLSSHLVPKYVFFVDQYPKTASGKIQKFKLRERGAALLQQGEGV